MKPKELKLSFAEAKCTTDKYSRETPPARPSKDDYLIVKCKFGRRTFSVKLGNTDRNLATFVHLAEAIEKETSIPCEKQRLLFKGVIMDPPDLSGFSTLQELNIRSGDEVLVVNSLRVGVDDREKREFEELLPMVKVTDKALSQLIYDLDKLQRGFLPSSERSDNPLEKLRVKGLALEKDYMKYIEAANNLKFDYRNAVDQARRRDMIDACQRQMDKIGELSSSIFDKLALANASVGGRPVLTIATKDGPCPRAERPYFPCQ